MVLIQYKKFLTIHHTKQFTERDISLCKSLGLTRFLLYKNNLEDKILI